MGGANGTPVCPQLEAGQAPWRRVVPQNLNVTLRAAACNRETYRPPRPSTVDAKMSFCVMSYHEFVFDHRIHNGRIQWRPSTQGTACWAVPIFGYIV